MIHLLYLWNIITIYVLLILIPNGSKGQNCPPYGYYNISQFGDTCQYRCRCVNEKQCDGVTGSCTEGCTRGWIGPGCQYRNLASTDDHTAMYRRISSDSRFVVDGNVTTCISLNIDGESEPWWRIDFQRVYYIVGLILRSTTEIVVDFRVEGSNYTDFQPTSTCYRQMNTTNPKDLEIMCYAPMIVRHIRIIVSTTSGTFKLCDVGIYGGRYISYKGTVSQSSQFTGWSESVAAAAVDGRPMYASDDQEKTASRTCAVTEKENTGHWILEFENYMLLQGIYVFGRRLPITPAYTSQLARFRLSTISDDGQLSLIYEDKPTKGNNWQDYQPRVIDLSVPIISPGVAIYNNPDTTDHLSLCEVEVFAECVEGRCGWDCSDVCHCSIVTTGSYRKEGRCPYGCKHRWTGQNGRCDSTCPDNTWGPDCASFCFCSAGSLCDLNNGTCRGKCASGWKGQACNTTCDNTTYGESCNAVCGRCLDRTRCYATSGYCLGDCVPGWKGNFCNETCNDYYYGVRCNSRCGHCLNSETCIKTTGVCPTGCEPGYKPPLCEEDCPRSTYGSNCQERCGICNSSLTCDASSGTCPYGCAPGYHGELCNVENSSEGLAIGPIIGGVTGAVIVIVVTVVLSVVCLRRKAAKRETNSEVETRYDDVLDGPKEADVYENAAYSDYTEPVHGTCEDLYVNIESEYEIPDNYD